MKKTGRLKQLLALMLAGALTVGSVGVPVFGADFGDTVVETVAEEETLDADVSEETHDATVKGSDAGAVSDDAAVSEDNLNSTVEAYTVMLDANGGYFENEWDDTLNESVERTEVLNKVIPVGGTVNNIVPIMEQENVAETFMGWSLEPDGEVVSLAEEEYIPVDNCVLYAAWQVEEREEIEGSETALPETNAEESVQEDAQENIQDETSEDNPTEFTAEGETAQEEYLQEPVVEEETEQEDSLEQVVEEETTQEEDSLYSKDSQESEESFVNDEESEVTDGDSQDNEALETDEGVEEVSSDIPHDTGIDDETAIGEQADTTGKEQSISTDGEIEIDKAAETISTAPLNGQAESVTYSSGNCGNGVTYVLEYKDDTLEDGMLTISGSGAMSDYRITDTSASDKFPYTSAPWSNSNVFQIASVNVNNGVTHIGNYAFCGAGGVTAAEISGSVKTIGAGSFWGCASLTDMVIPEGVESIGTSAFYYCANMKSITLPASIVNIDKSAFYLCSKLTDVYYDGTEDDWNSLVENGIESYRNENLLNAQIHFAEGTKVTLWNNYEANGTVQNKINSFTWSCGSFFRDKDDNIDAYDCFYMQIEWEEDKNLEGVDTVEVILPEGFSFEPDKLVDKKTALLQNSKAVLEVYPIYSENDQINAFQADLFFYASSDKNICADRNIEVVKINNNGNSGKVLVSDNKYAEVGFSAEWFAQKSNKYNQHLAVLNAALSAMAYLQDDLIRTSYFNLGFSGVEIYHGSTNYYGTTVNCSMARKKIVVDEKILTLVALPVRGTTDILEWISNVNLGLNTDHAGFENSKEDIETELSYYLTSNNLNPVLHPELRLLLSGHSRGAAAVNLLAADYDSRTNYNPDNIYCYTFATPNNTKNNNISASIYDNIFNITYSTDIVPSVAPRWLGFNKYGITYALPNPYMTAGYATHYEPGVKETYQSYRGEEYDPVRFEDYALAFVTSGDASSPEQRVRIMEKAGKIARTCGKKLCFVLNTITSATNLIKKILCAHDMLGYLSWMENISGTADLSRNMANYKVVRIACPVDVEVRDSAGSLVGKVSNDTVDHSCADIYAMAIEGVKYLFLPCSDTFQITITATDSGEMAYSVFEYDEDGLVSRSVNAYGIELQAGKTFQTSVNGVLGTDKKNYQIRTSDNKTIIPELEIDETQYQDTEDVEALIPDMMATMEGDGTGNTTNDAEIVATGSAGNNAKWALDVNGTMTFSGYGKLADYSYGFDSSGYESTNIPWSRWKNNGYAYDEHGSTDYRSNIKKVVFEPGITYVGNNLLRGCTNITEITIPDSVTGIGNYAFHNIGLGCRKISIPPALTFIGVGAFEGCGIEGSLVIPENVNEISDRAFSGCPNLTEVHLHEGITKIGEYAFAYCSSIKTFSVPDSVKSIDRGIIQGCTSIYRLEIGGGIVTVPESAFSGLDHLLEVKLQNGITSIGTKAFLFDTSLVKISFPDSLESIGAEAFSSCEHLSNISFGTGLKTIGSSAFSHTGLKKVTLPLGVTTIGDYAFCESDISEIIIPDSVTEIGEFVFLRCTKLKKAKLGDGITIIPKSLFTLASVETISLGNHVKRIEEHAFDRCNNIVSINIPSSIEYIGQGAFIDCSSLVEVEIPDSVTFLGKFAFSGCAQLERIKLSTQLEAIYEQTFEGCSFSEISIPKSIKDIGNYAFTRNSRLKKIEIPEGVINLGHGCFSDCSVLEDVTLPESLDIIKPSLFKNCNKLKQIHIPKNVMFIGSEAFEGCSSLENVDIEEQGLVEIENIAFCDCKSLKNIILPDTLLILGSSVFSGCSELNSVVFSGNAPSIGQNCFSGNTMYAFYPEENDTWTSDIMKDYGGRKVIWHTICDPHSPKDAVIENKRDASCEEDGYQESVVYCSKCGLELSREEVVFPKIGHKWDKGTITFEPTLYAEGEKQYNCLICGAYKWESIPKIKPTSIENATISGISDKTYTGSAIKQTLVVKLGTKTLTSGTDYTVSYKDNVNVGTATVVIKGKEYYTGTITKTFKINKANQSITAKSSASSVAVGKTATISISGAKGTKSYKSSNTAIATVTSTGKLTAKKVGTVKITATCAATSNFNAASRTVTIKVVPAATASISSANQAKGINLVWKKVTGATGYLVYRGSTKIATIKSGSTVTYTDSKANTNGTKYTYKIIPTASTGNGPAKSVTAYCVARPAISSMTNSASKRMTVKWGKNAKASGYQIHYCTDKTFKTGNKSVSVTSAATVSKAIDSLTKGKTYYVRIRTYKTVGSTKYFSAWSPVKSVKISK